MSPAEPLSALKSLTLRQYDPGEHATRTDEDGTHSSGRCAGCREPVGEPEASVVAYRADGTGGIWHAGCRPDDAVPDDEPDADPGEEPDLRD